MNHNIFQILLDIDSGKKFDVEDLAMYDLTPYFKESDEPNLYETIILNKKKQALKKACFHLLF